MADYYEEEVDNLVDNLTTLMEPMIMAVGRTCWRFDYRHVPAYLPDGSGGIIFAVVLIHRGFRPALAGFFSLL